jgi:hypothetical protein
VTYLCPNDGARLQGEPTNVIGLNEVAKCPTCGLLLTWEYVWANIPDTPEPPPQPNLFPEDS